MIKVKNIVNITRKVRIVNGEFNLETDEILNTEYAFYLNHKKGTEKVFYSSSSRAVLQTDVEPGDYSARFFYKIDGTVYSSTNC